MNDETQKLQQEIAGLKVRVFDAEEAARVNAEYLSALAQMVNSHLELGAESLEDVFKALQEKMQPTEVEAEAE